MEAESVRDIVIPVELCDGRFTTQEIGTMVIALCWPHLSPGRQNSWAMNLEFCETYDDLESEEYITHDSKGNYNIDLTYE